MNTRHLIYIILTGLIASCEPENTPPIAAVFSLPGTGDTTTVFMLDGKNSSDNESSYFILRYRWDVDADGTWETAFSTRSSYTARFSRTGYQKYILEVADEDGGTATAIDSVFILSPNRQVDILTDSRDGNRYRIVKIGENWWMAENLRYGTPVPCNTTQTNNDLAEFLYFNNSINFEKYGGLYTWVEANYYPSPALFRDICPTGWRIPSPDQWSGLFKTYSQPFGILYYFGVSSIENLGIEMKGYYKYGDPKNPMEGEFKDDRSGVRYWTSGFTGEDTTRYFTGINFSRDSWNFVQSFNRTEWIYHPLLLYIIGYRTPEACYVRCIKQ
ncbi:MAG: hypothetical protein D4R64_09525 [Porphyromonadaceae bacterium]|nr:MAG: hypothetical protein D4R64_09525 [Porphyromonadaceae bacterium]